MRDFLEELRYIPYLLSHPINGFWEMKKEKRGSLKTASFILGLYVVMSIISEFMTAYIFNNHINTADINVLLLILPIFGLFLLWCVSSWCLTSLFDGEGSFYDVVVATGYSVFPLLVGEIVMLVCSYAFSADEASLYTMIGSVCTVWFVFMLFIGTMVTHQYTFGKTILICICTLLGICIMVYIALLFINLIQQMSGFVISLFNELQLHNG